MEKQALKTRSIQGICELWAESDRELLINTLSKARASGFRRSFPTDEHTRLKDYTEALDRLFEKYSTQEEDRRFVNDAVISELQAGYRREFVKKRA